MDSEFECVVKKVSGGGLFYTVDSNGNVVDTIVLTFIVRHTNLTESKANALADLFELQQTTGGFLTKNFLGYYFY